MSLKEYSNKDMQEIEDGYAIFKTLFDNSSDGVLVIKDGKFIECNETILKMLQYISKEELLNAHPSELSPKYQPDGQESYKKSQDMMDIAIKNGSHIFEWIHKKANGENFLAEITLTKVALNDYNVLHVLWKDISKQREADKKVEEANYNFKQYLNAIDDIEIGIFVVDDDFKIQYMNNTMIEWFGDQSGKTCYSSVAGLNEPCPYCKLHEVIDENLKVLYEPTTPDGQSFDIVATSIKNSDGTTSKMEIIRNVTDKKIAQKNLLEQKEELDYQAHHDSLTGLPNRKLFDNKLEDAIENSKQNSSKVALLFIDLDHFKEINDSYGHKMGDEVLKIVTQKLSNIIRDKDTLARLGGDEFTITIGNLTQAQDASILAKKIIDILAQPIKVDENVFYVSSSIGISLYPDDGNQQLIF